MDRNAKKITPFMQTAEGQASLPKADPAAKVMKGEAEKSTGPQPYEFMKLNKRGRENYQDLKDKVGSLAVTDKEYSQKDRKSSRFQLNPMLRGALKIEDEEQRAIEMLVKTQVAKLAGLAQKEASDRGYNEGFAKGKMAAETQYTQEFQARIQSFDSLLKSIDAAKSQIFIQNEKFIIDTLFQMTKMVLLKELKEDRTYLTRLTRELVEKMGTKENVSVLVSKDDLANATQIQESLEKAIGTLQNLQIEASDKVELGGCIIETQWNTIDARIEVQLARLKESLGGHNPHAPIETAAPEVSVASEAPEADPKPESET